IGNIKQKEKVGSRFLLTQIAGVLIVAFAYVVFYGLYENLAPNQGSLISSISQFALLDLDIGRVDWVLVLMFEISTFISSATFVYMSAKCLKDIFGSRTITYILIPLAVLMYVIDIALFKSVQVGAGVLSYVTRYFYPVIVVLVPISVLVASIVANKKDKKDQIKNGVERFKYLLEGAVSDMDYKLLTAASDIDTESEAGRVEYLGLAAQIIAECGDVITRDVYIGKICEKYGVSRTAITAKVEELRKATARRERRKEINDILSPKITKDDINPERRSAPRAAKAEEGVIAVLLQHPDYFEKIKDELPPDKMITSLNRRIYTIIYDILSGGDNLDVSVFGQRLLPAELGFVVALQNGERAETNAFAVLKDCIKVILEEGMIKAGASQGEASVEDWAKDLQSLIDKKQKGN
ncbi:MAG: hypothetical protein II201_00410, partial [Clostridia bacterium]|nr:hypothetical protein [Clostridia bacterium]